LANEGTIDRAKSTISHCAFAGATKSNSFAIFQVSVSRMTTAWSGRKSSLFQNFAKKLYPEALNSVYLDTMNFFFGVDLKRRGNF